MRATKRDVVFLQSRNCTAPLQILKSGGKMFYTTIYGVKCPSRRVTERTVFAPTICCAVSQIVCSYRYEKGRTFCPAFLCYITLPSVVIILTATGIFLPLSVTAFLTACSIPPQHGTSIRATVMLRILFLFTISPSFSE